MKICSCCHEQKDESEFYRRGKYLHSRCKVCYCAYYRLRYAMYEATGTAALRIELGASQAPPFPPTIKAA